MALLEEIRKVNEASRQLSLVDGDTINALLMDLAQETEKEIDFIVQENQKDLDRMDPSDPKYDRLLLTPERIKSIANDIRNVAALKSPLGIILEEKHQPNGLLIKKIRVPLGVIGIIYESRPNVTFDVFALCLKSGNACVLKGSKDAHDSNVAIVSIIKRVIAKYKLPTSILFLLPPEREATSVMLNAVKYIDLVIPRGSQGLINFVRENSKIPTIETGAGICHTYFDEFADVEKGSKIIFNAKTRRVSVCNALDCLIIHSSRLNDLAKIGALLQETYTELFADELAYQTLASSYPSALLNRATDESFGTEFLSNKMAVKTVDSIEEAIAHIFAHSSKHSEAIISENQDRINQFLMSVDASAVYANTSTAFTDGAQFGLGAEIGISTQKLHARGPMALDELTSYKWIVIGDGQVRA